MTVSLGTRALQAMSIGLIAVLVVVGVMAPMASAYARQSDPASAAVGPIVGERVRISDSNGEEAAAVSVARLEDPYELQLAEPGFRYVLAEVVVEYTGNDVIEAEANNFTILDTQGFTYDAETAFLHRLDGPEDGGETPGQAWGTELLFQLPVDAVLAQVRFGELPLVDLRPERVTHGDVVSIVGPDRAELANISVGPPSDPYEIPLEVTGIVLENERYVAYSVEVTATGDRPFVVDPADFWVIDDQGVVTREMPRGEYQSDPNGPWLQPNDGLQPGETASGLIKFLLPDGVTPQTVFYSPIRDDVDQFIVLAEPDEPPPAATSEPIWVATPDAVTPGCEGVVEWAEELLGRLVQASDGVDVEILDDPASADPASLRQAAATFDTLATEQTASVPPPAAAEANTATANYFSEISDWLEAVASAVESGDQAKIDETVAALAEIGARLNAAFADLESTCPEVVDLL